MAWSDIPTRTTADANSSTDINQLMENIDLLGGNSGSQPSTDIETLYDDINAIYMNNIDSITINSTLAVNSTNLVNATSRLTLTLPAVAAQGDIIQISDIGGFGYKIKPGASQVLKYYNIKTVTGETANSYVQSKTSYSNCTLLCTTANTTWQATIIQDEYDGVGYLMGGVPAAVTAVIEQFSMRYETCAVIYATLDTAVRGAMGTNSNVKAYALGGYNAAGNPVATINDMDFALTTSTQLVATLDTASCWGGSCSSNDYGYTMGGYQPAITSTIERINFTSESESAIAETLDTARYQGPGISSISSGYMLGGWTGARTDKISNLVYATELSSELVAVLSAAKQGGCAVQGELSGFYMGGNTAAADTAVIEKLNLSSEAMSTLTCTFDAARDLLNNAGISGLTKGYCCGGETGGVVATIDDMHFTVETSQVVACSLDTAKGDVCGVSGCI